MPTLRSDYHLLCAIDLPYRERQLYMHTFDLAAPKMAEGYEDYLTPVTALCSAAGATSGLAHMTVDEKIIEAGRSQRRPRPHVDGCFMPSLAGSGNWGHKGPGWAHGCNNIALEDFKRMPVIVAASVAGCRAWRGEFEGTPASDGDLSFLDLPEGEILTPGVGYLLSADCVHESMIQDRDVRRTFLRIALPTDFEFAISVPEEIKP